VTAGGRARVQRHHSRRGSSVLYAVVLSPILLLSLALAVEVGVLQLTKQRLRSAVDQAAVVAVAGRAQAGPHAQLDRGAAAALLRTALAENLRPLAHDIDGISADDVASNADVAVITEVPAPNPFDPSALVRRATVEVRARIPVRTGLLSVAGVPATVTLTLVAAADLRVTGGTGP